MAENTSGSDEGVSGSKERCKPFQVLGGAWSKNLKTATSVENGKQEPELEPRTVPTPIPLPK